MALLRRQKQYSIWREGDAPPPSKIKTLAVDLGHLEKQSITLPANYFFQKLYYKWLLVDSKRKQSFARYSCGGLLSFANKSLENSLTHYGEVFHDVPNIALIDDLMMASLGPYLNNSLWSMFLCEQETYVCLSTFKNKDLVFKRRFFKHHDLSEEIQATLRYLSRHGYKGEDVFAYYLNPPGNTLFPHIPCVTFKRLPCCINTLVEEGLRRLKSDCMIYPPHAPVLKTAKTEGRLKKCVSFFSAPLAVAATVIFLVEPYFVRTVDASLQQEYNDLIKKDDKEVLFDKLDKLNISSFDAVFLRALKREIVPLLPQGVHVDVKKEMMQLHFKADDYILREKAMKLAKAMPQFSFQAQKNIITLGLKQGKVR